MERKVDNIMKKNQSRKKYGWECPNCGTKSITITFDRKNKKSKVLCGQCNIDEEIEINRLSESIDIYGNFIDLFYEKIKTIKQISFAELEKGFLEF